MAQFNTNEFNTDTFNGELEPLLWPPPLPPNTIANPLAPRPQQLTNFATLINGQYREAGVLVFKNGLLQTEGLDYTRNGGALTMLVPPVDTDKIVAQVFAIGRQLGGANPNRYIAPWGLPVTGKFDGISTFAEIVFGATISGECDGRNNLFTWGVVFQRVKLFRNGILQTIAQDYSAGPTAIVFFPKSIPQVGDILTLLGYNGC